jgi:hypothetical protein
LILIMLGKECKLWSSSLCSFLEPSVTSSFFGNNLSLPLYIPANCNLAHSCHIHEY